MTTAKYKLTKETISVDGKTLYRIEALKDFSDVKKGDKGGFVENEDNLSQSDECWVYDDAAVYGNARVFGGAIVCDNAIVRDNAVILTYAKIYDHGKGDGHGRRDDLGEAYGIAVGSDNGE